MIVSDGPRFPIPRQRPKIPVSMEGEFLDVQTLLNLSQPRPRIHWFWYTIAVMSFLAMIALLGSGQAAEVRQAIDLLSLLIILALMGATTMNTLFNARRHRAAQQTVETIEELIQLRRWQQA